uniref:Uncharacterized protein n=1 Tax=viral metagenome TaxID=1070528 RepID=A0A6C0HCL0_9ZZZZ
MHNFLLKSILGFENWTKKMSKIENRKHFSEKNLAYTDFARFHLLILVFLMINELVS